MKTELTAYREDKECPECKDGFMLPTGMTLMTYPCKYTHVCNKCGRSETYKETYPRIIYEDRI